MNAKGDPNNWHIEVYPRNAGNFGICSISGIYYDDNQCEILSRDIMDEIKRHVNDVQGTYLVFDSFLCTKCGNHFNTSKEAEDCCKEE